MVLDDTAIDLLRLIMDRILFFLMIATYVVGSHKSKINRPTPFLGNLASSVDDDKYYNKATFPHYPRDDKNTVVSGEE